jgi:hypothetical protein
MEPMTLLYLGMAAFVLLILGVWYLGRTSQVRGWRSLAEQNGLTFSGGVAPWKDLSISGAYRGRELLLQMIMRGSTSKNRRYYTRVTVTAKSGLIPQMEIKPEGVFEFFGKIVGWQDIEIGNEPIDKKYTITGQPVAEVMKMLSSLDLQQRLQEMSNVRSVIQGSSVSCEKNGVEKDPDTLQKMFDLVSALAEQAERSAAASGQV